VPNLRTGEALVELHASAINPSEVKNVAGAFKASLPRIPGRDFVGMVVAGERREGKEVWGQRSWIWRSRAKLRLTLRERAAMKINSFLLEFLGDADHPSS
jgi:NADPH:quinone reductase-like Zn-dependent oxidoreductase